MIGSGLKKLAKKHDMKVEKGIAYGSLMGYATTLSEGLGYKRIDISTSFEKPEGMGGLIAAVNEVNVNKEYRVIQLLIQKNTISVLFQDTIGTMKKVEAFIDWFYPMLAQYGASGVEVCSQCGQAGAGGWYLFEGIVRRMHESCAEKEQCRLDAERENRTGSYVTGAVGAVLGALLGSVLWALVLAGGYMVSFVGLAIAWLAEKGYTLLKGKQGRGKLVILVVAVIIGVLVGTIAPEVVTLVDMINQGELFDLTYADIPEYLYMILMTSPDYTRALITNAVVGLLLAALGVLAFMRRAGQSANPQKLKKLN